MKAEQINVKHSNYYLCAVLFCSYPIYVCPVILVLYRH